MARGESGPDANLDLEQAIDYVFKHAPQSSLHPEVTSRETVGQVLTTYAKSLGVYWSSWDENKDFDREDRPSVAATMVDVLGIREDGFKPSDKFVNAFVHAALLYLYPDPPARKQFYIDAVEQASDSLGDYEGEKFASHFALADAFRIHPYDVTTTMRSWLREKNYRKGIGLRHPGEPWG